MVKKKVVHHPQLGEITYTKTARARRISISLRPLKGIVVTLPPAAPYALAEAFVSKKTEWIKKAKARIEHLEKQQTVFTENTVFSTRNHLLELIPSTGNVLKAKITPTQLLVSYPNGYLHTKEVQEGIRKAIENTYRFEAKTLLPLRLDALAKQHNFNYSGVKINSARTRWGSCTGRNSINLSLHLLRLPDELIDYVLLHELCHTVHKNHGPQFWALLDKVTCGQAKALAKQLKTFTTKIF